MAAALCRLPSPMATSVIQHVLLSFEVIVAVSIERPDGLVGLNSCGQRTLPSSGRSLTLPNLSGPAIDALASSTDF